MGMREPNSGIIGRVIVEDESDCGEGKPGSMRYSAAAYRIRTVYARIHVD